jgi:phage N-6-adenine-methyltransferase
MINKGMMSSDIQTYETPIELFNKLDQVFKFELDVCAEDNTAKCRKYYTPETNGLDQEWKINSWMNPPYGREQIKWIQKAECEFEKYKKSIVCLIPSRTDSKIWHETIFKRAKGVCFIKGRIKFGDCKYTAPFPNALIIFSTDINEDQKRVLESLGTFLMLNN